jgi:glycosyltransferase involved in cell wall biosynthesis
LIPELSRLSPDDVFVLFGDPEKLKSFLALPNVKIIEWKAPIYSLMEQFFPYSKEIDLLHVPHFNIPLMYTGKLIVTVHDLIYLFFPRSVPSPVAKQYASFMIGTSLKKARKVITVSENTKKDLMIVFGNRHKDKIRVTYEAPGKMFVPLADKAKIADVACRYRLSERIILYVGSVKPHKNVANLIKMFALLRGWGLPHQLVLCGRWDKKEDALRERLSDRYIRYLGEIPLEDLVAIYSMADVLVHLSLYEGFGLTVLEAMQCGAPVVVSDRASLPEVAGKAAFVVPPENVEHIADTVYNVLINQQLRSGMIEAGFEHVKQFSWEETAKKTLEAYKSA